jgi:hypothetical protein
MWPAYRRFGWTCYLNLHCSTLDAAADFLSNVGTYCYTTLSQSLYSTFWITSVKPRHGTRVCHRNFWRYIETGGKSENCRIRDVFTDVALHRGFTYFVNSTHALHRKWHAYRHRLRHTRTVMSVNDNVMVHTAILQNIMVFVKFTWYCSLVLYHLTFLELAMPWFLVCLPWNRRR